MEIFLIINLIIDIVLMEHPDLFWYRTTAARYQINSGSGITLEHRFVSTNKLRLYYFLVIPYKYYFPVPLPILVQSMEQP